MGSLILVIKFCRLLSILDEKKMGEERMRENEGVCLFENKRVLLEQIAPWAVFLQQIGVYQCAQKLLPGEKLSKIFDF